VLGSDSLV